MTARRRIVGLVTAAALASGGALATAAPSSAAIVFLNHVAINSGNQAQGPNSGTITAVTVQSHGVAYSGAYVTNASGVRVSAVDYCNTPGCVAQIGWPGSSKPYGYPTGRNHGNASISYFSGVYD